MMASPNTPLKFKSVRNTGRRYPYAVKARVLQLAMEGVPRREITNMTGISEETVSSWLKHARKSGQPIPDCRRVSQQGVLIRIPNEIISPLERIAKLRRDEQVTGLIARLLRAIASEPTLIYAILDEPEPVCEPKGTKGEK